MSIPPLVCCTPPPPEQCEDDKEPEDFDLHYNLSQEEDDNNDYEFENHASFKIHTSENSKDPSLLPPEIEIAKIPSDSFNTIKNINKESLNHIPDLPIADDVHIEDLNLEINQEPIISSTKTIQKVCYNNSGDKVVKDLHTDIPLDSNNVSQNDFKLNANDENSTESEVFSQNEKPDESFDDTTDSLTDKKDIVSDNESENLNSVTEEDRGLSQEPTGDRQTEPEEDDFEDFDDFKFVSSDIQSETVADSADPWGSNTAEDVGFGEFTANFENVNTTSCEPMGFDENPSATNTQILPENANDDDDFGDFGEFKSPTAEDKASKEPLDRIQHQQVPVFNIHSNNENQIIESINKVLETVFPEEISESELLENKLEVSLGETWSYIKETDTRQPYMVNWNNSLAQKTLLRALCIDSRNILYGPRWSFNTPKYAANLSVAPLQPQKQITQMNVHHNEQSSDVDNKAANKSSWVDPFTSDGQESCSVDSDSNVTETGPTDLDVFEAAISSKTDKIYSNTLSIQPIRQINLPDTHIFTPTDSETPRSKTIHYDDNTTHNILVPQSVPSLVKDQPSDFSTKPTNNDFKNDDDYWDFQDFRSNSDSKSTTVDSKLEAKSSEISVDNTLPPKPRYPLETQVLQPIKLEPIMPTLNWPDPGEVKETFDDFSDFISKSVAMDDKQSPGAVTQNRIDVGKINAENFKDTNSDKQCDQDEDDFDTFQSALPTSTAVKLNCNPTDVSSFGQKTTKIAVMEPTSSKNEKIKSDNISFVNTRPTENSIQNIGNNTSNFDELNFKTHSAGTPLPNCSLLQPTVTSPTQQGQQKTGQILQPLSLESYSQINWPNPGIDLQDLSRFNPVESLQSFKSEASSHSKNSSPIHNQKPASNSQVSDEDIWGEFVSSKPRPQQAQPKKLATFADDDEWTDFVSSPSVNTQNGLNTISLNVQTNSNIQKSSNKYPLKNNNMPLDIPSLNYITPKTGNQKSYNDRHFQNL